MSLRTWNNYIGSRPEIIERFSLKLSEVQWKKDGVQSHLFVNRK